MSDHLHPASPAYWGALFVSGEWRLIVQPRSGYALQSLAGSEWETVQSFPTAAWLCAHLHGVYDVPTDLSDVADRFPELPPKGKAERLALLRDIGQDGGTRGKRARPRKTGRR